MIEFPHKAPEGYSYEFEVHNARLTAIWMRNHNAYSYTTKSIRSIWGFYSPKKKQYFAPINSSKCGNQVSISQTTPYSAMQLQQTPLEKAFV